MSSEKREFSEDNPFKEINPNEIPALMWEKIHTVEKISVENRTDIKWLKKEYAIQIAFSIGTFLTLIGFIYKILVTVIIHYLGQQSSNIMKTSLLFISA